MDVGFDYYLGGTKMKNNSSFFKFFLAISLCFLMLFTPGCQKTREQSMESSAEKLEELKPVKVSVDSLNIMVDPRIELLTSIQLNSDYFRLTKLDLQYKDKMKEYFKNHTNHDAVKTFKELNSKGFNYDAPPTSMLFLTNPLKLEQKIQFTDYLKERAGDEDVLKDFIAEAKNFAIDTNFTDFYKNNKEFYRSLVDSVANDVKDLNLTTALDDYYGMDRNSYNIVLAPLFHSGGYGPRIIGENGLYDIYGIIGPTKEDAGTPGFSKKNIKYIVWHEFSHSFVNPTTERYKDEINKYEELFEPIKNIMEDQAYGQWQTCVNEHIVRAITARLTYIHDGEAAGDNLIVREKSKGFFYIEHLIKELEVYEKNRDLYPTFEDFYPNLIKVFKELSESELGDDFYSMDFQGPINAVFNTKGHIVLIVPTNEGKKETQEEINSYVKKIQSKFFKDSLLLKDTEALKGDLTDCTVICYGTVEGNLWLNKYKSQLPFKMSPDKVAADKDYIGNNLRLISGLKNPLNPEKPLIVYTAQTAEDIIDINNVFHGPTDYVIAKDKEVLGSGNYIKNGEKWSFE